MDYCHDLKPGDTNTYRVKVSDVIYEGGLVKYFVECDDGHALQIHDRSTRFLTDTEELSVYFDPARLWIIPQDTGGASGGKEPASSGAVGSEG